MRAVAPAGWAKERKRRAHLPDDDGHDAKSAFAHPTLDGFPPPPQYHFHGRVQELLELERAFRKHPAVLLHAMGGMGKTALAREAAH
uniref:AAA ATPase domain-containing protein n=1 Tax=Candidatus Kentrum sp. FW TaxID=2126338 RepID=A0A450TCI6_9GAMM|nr:MAG: hypothetical protein BECKFW1821C_GA0114237_10066 [Candidatus Kentron sp. FW]